MKTVCWLLFFTAASLFGQTTGTTLPTNCIAGQIYTKTNAPAGQNLYVALSTGQPCPGWTVQGGSSAVGVANAVQATNGAAAFVDSGCTATAGQITCPSGFVSTSSSPTLITMNYGTPPAPPGAGKVAVYADSGNTGLSAKAPDGTVTRTIKPTDCTSVGLVQKINPDGTVGCAAGGGGTGGQYITTVPTIPATPGTDGQYTMDAAYYYAYKSRWYRVAWDTTWSNGAAAAPTFAPPAGTYSSTQTVTISTASAGCGPYIYWKIGGTPTATDNHGTTASVATTGVLHAKVIGCPVWTDSSDGTAAYTIAGYVGPGDVVSGAIAWYGLRAYSSATAGTRAARICNAGFVNCVDVITLANGNLDMATVLAAPLSCGGAGGQCLVYQVYDQTGNGNDAIFRAGGRTVIGNAPALTLNCIGSLPCITFTVAYAAVANATVTQPFSLDIVAQRTANFSSYQFVGGSGGNIVEFGWANSPDTAWLEAGALLTGPMTDAALHAFQGHLNGTTSSIFVDGISVASGPAGATNMTSICFGGCDAPFYGRAVEYGVWGGNITASAAALSANQHTYWGF